jgi:hypothetical protein
MTGLSAREAGERVGLTKQAIVKAIKNGRISATKDDTGEWRIEPAELFRVYPPLPTDGANEQPTKDTGSLQRELEVLRELVADLRGERDRLLGIVETQAQQVKQLTDQRPTPQPAERRGWWRRLVGR